MLVEAAAAKWSVDPLSCRTENGEVVHDASAQKASYGELVQAAAALTPPQNPPLKPATDFKLIGKSLKRLDTPDKVNGKAVYGIDARPPDVKIATLASCPVFGGKVAHVNDERAKTVPGVRQVIVLDDLVAVVGDHMWAAKKGLAALDITWDEGPNAAVSTADVLNGLVAAGEKAGVVAKTTGDIDKALGEGTSRRLRDLGRQSSHHPRSRGRREADGSAAGEGDRSQSSDRRRLRPAARSGLYHQGRAHRAECRRARESHLDP
jgi:isoquinoline 1-oxidoreductase beta subunit